MASIIACSCEVCTHNEVCIYKAAYEHIVSRIGNTRVSPPGTSTCRLSEVDFISSVAISCKNFWQDRKGNTYRNGEETGGD